MLWCGRGAGAGRVSAEPVGAVAWGVLKGRETVASASEELRITELPPQSVRLFSFEQQRQAQGVAVRLRGRFSFRDVVTTWNKLEVLVDRETQPGVQMHLDVSQVESIDGGTMALLVHLRSKLQARGVDCEFLGAAGTVAEMVRLYGGDVDPTPRKRRRPEGQLAQIGRVTSEVLDDGKNVLAFFGDMVLGTLGLLREPRTGNWKEVIPLAERCGADAVPIVLLINFLVGFVMAFQSAIQLRQFGANIYVADLIGLSVTKELGPLMTGIIVAGRSGAAFAAELGTMKVSEEIDALRTVGFGPMRYLVLPRALALIVVMPLLTIMADAVAIVGGMLVGRLSLDLTFEAYLRETQQVVGLWDVGQGLVKSVVFALAIALISCQQGFATTGGAEGVGKRTTASVVTILFSLILIDAAFTIFFYFFRIS